MELRNRNISTAFCSIFHIFHIFTSGHIFSHFQNTFFIFFKRIFKTHLFRFCFKKTVKKCEQGAFWTCTWKKCEKMRFENALGKNVKNCGKRGKKHLKSSWEGGTLIFFFKFDFFGPSFAAVTLLPAQLLQVENRIEMRESIGSGLCRSQICLIYL